MSLICAIVNPSSSAGSPASGTLTLTTGATRRAMKNPIMVMSGVNPITAMAEMRTQASSACAESTIAETARLTSRTSVSTSSHEKNPIVSQGRSARHAASPSRARKPFGRSQKQAASAATPAACAASPNGNNRRRPR